MIILNLQNINGLNNSLQVGDMIYASPTVKQTNAKDFQADANNSLGIGSNYLVGILRKIEVLNNFVRLYVDETISNNTYIPSADDFIMFSKYNRGGSGVLKTL